MKNYLKYIALVIIGTLASCKDDAQKPKVIYDASNKAKVVTKTDSTQIEVADLRALVAATGQLRRQVEQREFTAPAFGQVSGRHGSSGHIAAEGAEE